MTDLRVGQPSIIVRNDSNLSADRTLHMQRPRAKPDANGVIPGERIIANPPSFRHAGPKPRRPEQLVFRPEKNCNRTRLHEDFRDPLVVSNRPEQLRPENARRHRVLVDEWIAAAPFPVERSSRVRSFEVHTPLQKKRLRRLRDRVCTRRQGYTWRSCC